MKRITVELPYSLLISLEELTWILGASRGRLIQMALRDFLVETYRRLNSINAIFRLLSRPPENKYIKPSTFYKYCISCESPIHKVKEPYKYYNNFEIIELRFCCDCYKKFENSSLESFPTTILENIQRRLEKIKKKNE